MDPDAETLDAAFASFEARAYLEAHEHFEWAWRRSGTPRSLELHALAQIAAAMHKHHVQGLPEPARRIAARAAAKLAQVEGTRCSLDLEAVRAALCAYGEGSVDRLDGLPRRPR